MSGRAPFLAMALLASVLAAAITLELDVSGPPLDTSARATIHPAAPARPRASATSSVDHTEAWVETILARPLFSRDRRPTPVVAKSSGAEAITTMPRLTGVLVSPTEQTAIFAGADGGKPVIASTGTELGPYTVEAIAPGEVTVSGPEGTVQLHPSFDAETRKALLAQMPAPPQTPGQPGQAQQLPQQPGVPQPPALNLRPGSQFQRALNAIQIARPHPQNGEVDR